MATLINYTTYSSTTGALFKAWAYAFHTALSNGGWVQTSDTGQVNWSTYSSIPAVNTSVYEVWAMNDSLQSTAPIYLKVFYASGSTNGYPIVNFSVGTGTNGAGTLTNPVSSAGPSIVQDSVAANFYFSAASNRFACGKVISGSTNNFYFSVERLKDANGNDTVNGYHMVYVVSTSYIGQVTATGITAGTTFAVQSYGKWISFGTTGSATVSSQTLSAYPLIPVDNTYTYYPVVTNTLLGRSSDIAPNLFVQATVYGVAHPYVLLGTGLGGTQANLDGNTTYQTIWMRWE